MVDLSDGRLARCEYQNWETGCAVFDFRINFIKSFVIMMFIASQTLFEIVF